MKKSNFCFIRKNTLEIQERLKELGVPQNDFDKGNRPWIAYNHGMWITVDEGHNRLFPNDIDCGDNEDLFFALVALRDNTNNHQWFIAQDTMWDENYYGEVTVYYEKGDWLLWNEYSFMEDMPSDFKKATVEEIIEHFNKENES